MRHLIVGSGIVGFATGVWLEANGEEVYFNDIKPEALKELRGQGYKTSTIDCKADIYWVCTAEGNVEEVLSKLSELFKDPTVVVKSTTPPGTIQNLGRKYGLKHIAHVPEFLKTKTAIADIFDTDRVIIGTVDDETKSKLKKIYQVETVEVIFTNPTTSELIKYASNCWLATQISYWNEIKKICNKFNVNPQMVANASCLDKRISKYGTAMIGTAFIGFCLPKDLDALIKSFESMDLDPVLLKAVREVNERIKMEKGN